MKNVNFTLSIGGKKYPTVKEKNILEVTNPDGVGVVSIQKLALEDAMYFYILHMDQSGEVKKNTITSYWSYEKNYFDLIRTISIEDLTLFDIQRSINKDLESRGVKTVRNAYGFLKNVLEVTNPDFDIPKGALKYTK